jgi:DNA-binding PadR family transcriptional regulator
MSGRGRGPWGGWGGPPPWVAWGGHGFGGGRPRAAKGNVRTAILALRWEGPRHGYQLMQDIAERSNGEWRPSPGSIYPVLSALQDEGLVDDEKVEGKRVFTLTESGRAHVQERADELSTVFDAFAADAEAPEEADVKALLVDVASAAVQVMRSGTPAQVADAKGILAQVRRDLYRVLAEEQE